MKHGQEVQPTQEHSGQRNGQETSHFKTSHRYNKWKYPYDFKILPSIFQHSPNSKASDDNDYIVFHTFHNNRNNINYITEFSSGVTDFTVKYMVTLYKKDLQMGIMNGRNGR
jgi:hypothetical protein